MLKRFTHKLLSGLKWKRGAKHGTIKGELEAQTIDLAPLYCPIWDPGTYQTGRVLGKCQTSIWQRRKVKPVKL